MTNPVLCSLFAQASDNSLPPWKAIAIIVFFGAVAVLALVGLLSSSTTLESLAGIIGTKNPWAARIVCALSLLVGVMGVFLGTISLLGWL